VELLDFPIHLKSATQRAFIHNYSDVHYAALGCDKRKLRRDIKRHQELAEEGEHQHFWIGGGDMCNAISAKDKRFDSAALSSEFLKYTGDDLFGAEVDRLVDEFAPIREWAIGSGMGNHEDSQAKYNEFNGARNFCRQLDIPYLGYSASIRFRLSLPKRGAQSSVLYWHHGTGAGSTKAGKLNSLMKMGNRIRNADVYMCGHTHEIMNVPEPSLEIPHAGPLRLINRETLYINGGTYLKGIPTRKTPQTAGRYNRDRHVRPDYSEKKGYTPSIISHNGYSMQIVKDEHDRFTIDHRQVDWR